MLVPVFDADGIPKMKDGYQVYEARVSREQIEVLVAETARWLQGNPALDRYRAAAAYLRGAHPDILDPEVDKVAALAVEV